MKNTFEIFDRVVCYKGSKHEIHGSVNSHYYKKYDAYWVLWDDGDFWLAWPEQLIPETT